MKAILALGLVLAAQPGPQGLSPPRDLSPAARAVLKKRMPSHAFDMTSLVRSVVLLDYEQSRKLANDIAADANLARPLTGDATELNSLLPERFFLLQDELRASARRLAVSAQRRDAEGMADAFAQISKTCIRCHRVYIGPR